MADNLTSRTVSKPLMKRLMQRFDPQAEKMEQDILRHEKAKRRLNPRQVRALEALCTQAPNETFSSVAKRAGISRSQLYAYLDDPYFFNCFRRQVRLEFRAARMPLSRVLMAYAKNGDMAAMKMYFQIAGILQDTIETPDIVRSIEEEIIDLSDIPLEVREALFEAIKNRKKGLSSVGDEPYLDVESEAIEDDNVDRENEEGVDSLEQYEIVAKENLTRDKRLRNVNLNLDLISERENEQ